MVALLLAAFIVYLYVPHLLFKFAAAARYDFVTRKGLPQVEEFFAAGLPSFLLNLLTIAALAAADPLPKVPRLSIDWSAVAKALEKDPDLSSYVKTGQPGALITYLLCLGLSSWLAGDLYGRALNNIVLAGGPADYVRTASGPLRLALRAAAVLYRRFWRTFYGVYEEPFYPVMVKKLLAFVHTKQGLYHGIVYSPAQDSRR